jgi:hypothetical protein
VHVKELTLKEFEDIFWAVRICGYLP